MKIIVIYLLSAIYFFLSFSMDHMRSIGLYLIISVALFFWGTWEWRKRNEEINEENRRVTEEILEEIPHTQKLVTPNNLNALLINEVTEILYIASREELGGDFEIKDIPFNKVLEVALIEDGKTIAVFPKEGILSSPVNLGDIEEQDEEEEFEEEEEELEFSLCFKIVSDDLAEPIHYFTYLDDYKEEYKEFEEYEELMGLCHVWHQKLSIIIRRYQYDRVMVNKWS